MGKENSPYSGKDSFRLNQKRLNKLVKIVNDAAVSGEGIFFGGVENWRKRFLPQWNLPKELEYDPQMQRTRLPKEAANFLHLEAFCEVRNTSSQIMNYLTRLWNERQEWFFDPARVVKQDIKKIEEIMTEKVHFNFKTPKQSTTAQRYFENCELIVRDYEGNAANMVQGKTVAEAQKELRKLHNFGVEMPHMYICYLLDRQIASVKDPENALMKIDVHKGRLLINNGIITPKNGQSSIHPTVVARLSTQGYKQACDTSDYDSILTNDSCWVIGQVCKRKSFRDCIDLCPLYKAGLCHSNVNLDEKNGYFVIKDNSGKMPETRKGESEKKQSLLFQ